MRHTDIAWQLTEDEVIEKRLDWTRKTIKDIEYIEKQFEKEEPSKK